MFCKECGVQISDKAAFCVKCGAPTEVGGALQPLSSGTMDYAGFWRRVAALIIDSIILGIVGYGIGFVWGLIYAGNGGTDPDEVKTLGFILGTILNWLYFCVMESSTLQATVGKIALGIKVTGLDGKKIGFGKANGRYFGKFISALLLGIGFLMAGFTQRKQALHDMMAGTLVTCR